MADKIYEKSLELKKELYGSGLKNMHEEFLNRLIDFYNPNIFSPLEVLVKTSPKKHEDFKPSLMRKMAYSRAFSELDKTMGPESEIGTALLKVLYTREMGEISYNKLVGKY